MRRSEFLSVVVPTRNRALLLRDCLASLVDQDFPAGRYEIVVVDDGSVDETPNVVSLIPSRTDRAQVRYVRREGRGLNAARNAGLREAVGDPVVFVDDDVLAPRSWLTAMADGTLRHPEAACFGGPVHLRLEGKPPRLCDRDPLGESELELGDAERCVDLVIGANFCVRRVAVEMVGLFNESLPTYGDETEWEMRLTRAGGEIVYLPQAWLWHRRTAEDLKVFRLLGSRFRKGIANVAFARAIGESMSITTELRSMPRLLAHAVRRGCVGGLLSVSGRAGRAWELIRGQLRHLV